MAMAFIKINNVVINTTYIAAVRLQNQNSSGEKIVSLLMATPKIPLSQREEMVVNAYDYQWLDFEGQAANALEDYFSSFNNVIDLLPNYQERAAM
jgi:hypothetical protein